MIDSLRDSVDRLLCLGENGTPVYADEFCVLNKKVVELADALFPVKGQTAEQEAEILSVLLKAYLATVYDGDNRGKLQEVLDRIGRVIKKLPGSVLKCRLLLEVYDAVDDKELLDEAKEVIVSWEGRELTEDEKEAMGVYNEMVGYK